MKKLIYILFLLIGVLAFGQGGPKANTIKFVGQITSTIRDGWDVPVGEAWMIFNVTTTRLEYAQGVAGADTWFAVNSNTTSGGILATSAQNFIEVATGGPIGGTDFVRISGGTSPDEVLLYFTDNYAALSNYSNADIDAVGATSLITKG